MLTQEYLREILNYNPDTGIFTNKVTRSSRAIKGTQLNPSNQGNYGSVQINKQRYLLHRLAWFYVYGIWPKENIDHINRDTTDNRIANLREATQSQNMANNNVSKNKGIYKIGQKYRPLITINQKTEHIGYFNSKEEAIKAYNKKAQEYFGEFAVLSTCS